MDGQAWNLWLHLVDNWSVVVRIGTSCIEIGHRFYFQSLLGHLNAAARWLRLQNLNRLWLCFQTNMALLLHKYTILRSCALFHFLRSNILRSWWNHHHVLGGGPGYWLWRHRLISLVSWSGGVLLAWHQDSSVVGGVSMVMLCKDLAGIRWIPIRRDRVWS